MRRAHFRYPWRATASRATEEVPLPTVGLTVLRRLLPVLVVLAVAGSALAWWFLAAPSAEVNRLGAWSVAREWRNCLSGHAPTRQPDLQARYDRLTAEERAERLAARSPAPARVPLVEPSPPRMPVHLLPEGERSRPVVVAVVDSGVSAGHPGLSDAVILPGADLLNPCGDGHQDVSGHGTAVAGVVAASSEGARPAVRILPVRTSLAIGRHNRWVSAAGIAWAARQGADVINLSYTASTTRVSHVERAAIRYAARRGVVVVAAAGNDPHKPAGYPAAYPEVVSVTAVDGYGRIPPFAARSGAIDVAAVGANMLTLGTGPDAASVSASGTSLSAPVVSAAIAHLLSVDPLLSGAEAVAAVRETSVDAEGLAAIADRRPDQPPEWNLPRGVGLLDMTTAMLRVCRATSACQLPQWPGRPTLPSLATLADEQTYPDAFLRQAAIAQE